MLRRLASEHAAQAEEKDAPAIPPSNYAAEPAASPSPASPAISQAPLSPLSIPSTPAHFGPAENKAVEALWEDAIGCNEWAGLSQGIDVSNLCAFLNGSTCPGIECSSLDQMGPPSGEAIGLCDLFASVSDDAPPPSSLASAGEALPTPSHKPTPDLMPTPKSAACASSLASPAVAGTPPLATSCDTRACSSATKIVPAGSMASSAVMSAAPALIASGGRGGSSVRGGGPRKCALLSPSLLCDEEMPPAATTAAQAVTEATAVTMAARRKWTMDNVAGVVENKTVTRLAQVQYRAIQANRDHSLRWVYDDSSDMPVGATCDGIFFTTAEIKTFT